ncbi:hypothetical protein [Bradyrhizobium sp. DASA03120]|uniref:hypothetical protein n=1 Tax=Bradyrhizobium sp. SMVTL-02 TaxID=3395917 RepID=UPI003F6F6784
MSIASEVADRLVAARGGGRAVAWRDILPPDRAGAYAIQHATLARIGPVGGWKVGASGPDAEPVCAPLPASGLLASGARLGPEFRLRGVEVEVALRVGRALTAEDVALPDRELARAFDAVYPAIEVRAFRVSARSPSTFENLGAGGQAQAACFEYLGCHAITIEAQAEPLWQYARSNQANAWNKTRDEISDRLRAHFSEAQIVELTWRIALCGAFNRFNDILQLEVEQGVPHSEAAE